MSSMGCCSHKIHYEVMGKEDSIMFIRQRHQGKEAPHWGKDPGPCPFGFLHSYNACGTWKDGMKTIEASGLVYQILWSWLRAIRETITLLLQFAEHQAQWLLCQVSNNCLLKTLCPSLGSLIRGQHRMNAQLKTNHSTEERRIPGGSQNNSTGGWYEGNPTHSPSMREREKGTPPPSQSIYSLFDQDGRMDVFRMRKLVYERGTHPSERKITWKFLFGVYPEKSTTEERKELDQQMASQYKWMKHSWKQCFPWAACLKAHCDLELSLAIQRYEEEQKEAKAAEPPTEIYNEHNLPSQYVDERQFQRALKDIDADIPRTDRHRTFFQREGLVKLLYLRDILVTYVAFHQEIGYCHGMNDFASRFLETLDNETEAFWCFVGYMRRSAWSFTTMGVRRKTQICEEVLRHVDPELYHHIESVSKEKLIFCLRWLLLLFQKDLDHSDAVRVLEISALESEKMNFGAWTWFNHKKGEAAPAPFTAVDRDEITFEVLLCIAVLIKNRKQLLEYSDINDFFLFAQSVSIDGQKMIKKVPKRLICHIVETNCCL